MGALFNLKKILHKRVKNILPDSLLLYRGNGDTKQVALTFDDGPYPGKTEKILSILEDHKVKATFFMNGRAMENNKNIVSEIINAGHEVGNHLYNHKAVTALPYRELDKEVKNWMRVLAKITDLNNHPLLFRPPHGSVDIKTLWYAFIHGWTIVLWSVFSKDLDSLSLEENKKYLESLSIYSGDIILFHDDADYVEELIDGIIQKVNTQGFTFCKVSDFLRGPKR